MCEFCEKQKPLVSMLQQKFCTIESYVANIIGNELTTSAIVQAVDRGLPFHVAITFECDYCPKCGKDLRKQIDETLMPPNNVFEKLQQYCEKYGVKVEDRALNFDFVLELLREVERKCLKE